MKTKRKMRTKSKTRRLKQKGGDFSQFINLCKSGNLAGAKEYLRLHPDTNLSQDNEQAFRLACYFGHLELAQWLLREKPDINISILNNDAFKHSAGRGRLAVAQWLYQIKPDIIENITVMQKAFMMTCYSGHLAVAQWLLQMKPEIDISANNEDIFRSVCEHGYLNMAQWLLQVSKERGQDINISANNHEAFRLACREKHFNFAKWLETLKPEYEVIVLATEVIFKCNILTDPKDIKWKRRKQVVSLASPEAEDNILKRLPTDVARITGSYL